MIDHSGWSSEAIKEPKWGLVSTSGRLRPGAREKRALAKTLDGLAYLTIPHAGGDPNNGNQSVPDFTDFNADAIQTLFSEGLMSSEWPKFSVLGDQHDLQTATAVGLTRSGARWGVTHICVAPMYIRSCQPSLQGTAVYICLGGLVNTRPRTSQHYMYIVLRDILF